MVSGHRPFFYFDRHEFVRFGLAANRSRREPRTKVRHSRRHQLLDAIRQSDVRSVYTVWSDGRDFILKHFVGIFIEFVLYLSGGVPKCFGWLFYAQRCVIHGFIYDFDESID